MAEQSEIKRGIGLPGIGAAADAPRFFAATTARLEEGLLTPFRCQSAEGTGRVVSKVDRNGRTRAPGGRTGSDRRFTAKG